MKVKALKIGFYDNRKIKLGEVFKLLPKKGLDAKGNPKVFSPEDQFSPRWMENLEPTINTEINEASESPSIEKKKAGRPKKVEGI